MIAIAQPVARWTVPERDRAAEQRLQGELGIPSLLAGVLTQRGRTDPTEVHAFLNPSVDQLHDPSLLPDFAAARDAILGARERNETIFIHGDYDVDGVTSAALLSRFLRSIGCTVITHVPHRIKEGYGIHADAVTAAHATGAKLFLTCDCGISAIAQVEQANALGMTVVVTDHHSIGDTLPRAAAVINPHRVDSKYPFAELSGVGVAFKFCEGLTAELGYEKSKYYRAFLDLAALGTIADVMPLEGENRIIARIGLERLAETKKVGLQALMQEAKVSGKLRSYHVGFVLGPRLNAAGRIDDAGLALDLLLETDGFKAAQMAHKIEEINLERRTEQQRIVEEAAAMVTAGGHDRQNVIVVANEGWHTGIVGIVAGRLVDQFRRPTFVLSIDPSTGQCKGSARSIPRFHLADAIRAFPNLFTSGGGHAMAAGCSFPIENLAEITQALHAHAAKFLTEEDFQISVQADMEVAASEISKPAVEAMAQMEPFGCGNPEPVFVARNMRFEQLKPTKNPAHVRVVLRPPEGPAVQAIAFNIGETVCAQPEGCIADVLFQPALDEWNGATMLKWQIKDFEPLPS